MAETSIKKRLVLGVLSALLLAWLVVIALVYRSSVYEIGEVYDASLASYARVLATLMSHEAKEELDIQNKLRLVTEELGGETLSSFPVLNSLVRSYAQPVDGQDYLTLEPAQTNSINHHYESKIAFLIKAADGRVLLRSSSKAPLNNAIDGYATLKFANEYWRIFKLTENKSLISVIVGEKVEVREELLHDILVNVLWPLLFILPLIALLLFGIISKELKSLRIVADKVAKKSHLSLEPVSLKQTPQEVMPLVEEINHLFQRIEHALENERRFTANAAHELRTPLASIKTQVQVLQLSSTPELEPTIARILNSVDRATHLVEQLLTLARAETRSHKESKFVPLNLAPLIRSTIRDMAPLALDKNITLSFDDGTDEALIAGDEALLQVIIRNILDNAIRYTSVGGIVEVKAKKLKKILQLDFEDSGPGIPVEQQELLFQRFQRGDDQVEQGVGLGLYIVRQIASLHGIEIHLENKNSGPGLIFRLKFPLSLE